MRVYLNKTTLEAARERVNRIYDEFPNVCVTSSSGKDSTVCVELALEVARERNRLPLTIIFIDQETEYEATVEHMRYLMNRPEINPMWFQVELKLFNATTYDSWYYCWDHRKPEEWIREKEDIAIKENITGNNRFKPMFGAIMKTYFKGVKTAVLGGVRAEESPGRALGMNNLTYKDITWGKIENKKDEHYTFYPIYDWTYYDVWKYIFEHDIVYNRIYDHMYQHGQNVNNMRVSSLLHETAINSMYFLQEVEPNLWEKLTKRLDGINTAGQLKEDAFRVPKELPYMFSDWKEYRDYLLDNLVTDPEYHAMFAKKFKSIDEKFAKYPELEYYFINEEIASILANDFFFTKIDNALSRPEINTYKTYVDTGKRINAGSYNRFINAYNERIKGTAKAIH